MHIEIDELDRRYASLRIESAEAMARLTTAIVREGLQSPVLVVRAEPHVVLIDGYLRVRVLEELGRHQVQALELDIPESEALLLRHRLSASRRRSAIEDAWLMLELTDRHNLRQVDLGTKLGRSKSWVSRRLALVRVLPESVQEAVRKGFIPAQGAMKSLVPLARANSKACETLVANLGNRPISVRQLAQLITAYKQGDEAQQERILTHPWLFLKAAAEAEQPESADPKDASALLANDLEILSATCRRARRRLRDEAWSQASALQRGHLERCWRETLAAFDALVHPIEAERQHAASRHTNRDPRAPQQGHGHATDRLGAPDLPQCGEAGAEARRATGAAASP